MPLVLFSATFPVTRLALPAVRMPFWVLLFAVLNDSVHLLPKARMPANPSKLAVFIVIRHLSPSAKIPYRRLLCALDCWT